jgi:hypothetical protein
MFLQATKIFVDLTTLEPSNLPPEALKRRGNERFVDGYISIAKRIGLENEYSWRQSKGRSRMTTIGPAILYGDVHVNYKEKPRLLPKSQGIISNLAKKTSLD